MTEDVMVGRYHQHNGHEFEKTSGDRGGYHAAVHVVTKSRA